MRFICSNNAFNRNFIVLNPIMNPSFVLVLLVLFCHQVFSQNVKNIELAPKGIYAEIDVEISNGLVNFLSRGEGEVKMKAAEEVLKNPNNYNPTVLFALSEVLFNADKKNEACFWFYVAQLRGRYDVNRCMDKTAASGLDVLNESYGKIINLYSFKDIRKLKETVSQVVHYVRTNEEKYDPRWMNLHGMEAIHASLTKEGDTKGIQKELSQPRANWKAIKEKTIDDYYADFQEFLKSIK